MMRRTLPLNRAVLAAILVAAAVVAPSAEPTSRFEWSTKSAEAKTLLLELQGRIEAFQFGPENVALAAKIMAKDPAWCMAEYYMSAVNPGAEAQAHLDKALALAKNGSAGERRCVDVMYRGRANQGADFPKVVPELEQLSTAT